MHWMNALAMLTMIGSGWGIYDDNVLIHGVHFPQWLRLGNSASRSLLWHFAAMWLLAFNGLAYVTYGLVTGRFRERFLPIRWRELLQTVADSLRLRLAHEELGTYNAVQKLLYILVILAGISQVATGLTIWKPMQFSGLASLLGGFQAVRWLHFLGMSSIVLFLVVRGTPALVLYRSAMLTGGPRQRRPEPAE